MRPELIRRRQREMQAIWDSFEWLIREKLMSIDNNVRAMMQEMKIAGIKDDMMEEFLPRQFERLKREIVEEQSEKYDHKYRVM